jgi:hypothetical protein
MSRVLVVSSSASAAIGLSLAGHDVIDLRPGRVPPDAAATASVDVVVLDLDEAAARRDALRQVRAALPDLPAVIVDDSGTSDALGDPRAIVVPGPVTRHDLERALERIVGFSATRVADLLPLIREVTAHASELVSVTETARALVAEAVERTASSAGAVLVADAGAWHIAAGHELRPMETRIVLDDSHWLVAELQRNGSVLAHHPEGVQPPLYGVPLSSWPEILMMRVDGVAAAVVVARETPQYAERDVDDLAKILAEAGPVLAGAVAARELARALADLRD